MKTALYIVEDEGVAQYRYRVKNVQAALAKSKKWQVKVWKTAELGAIGTDNDSKTSESIDNGLEDADLVVIERQTAKNGAILRLIEAAQKHGIHVLMDLDDLVFDYRDMGILMRSTGARNVAYWLGYFGGIRRIAKRVDGFLVTNDFLGRKLTRSFKKPYQVIRNSLNQEQVEASEKMLQEVLRMQRQVLKTRQQDLKVCRQDSKTCRHDFMEHGQDFLIGYFSGSPTHAKDLALVEPELIRFLREHNNAKLLVVGYMKFSREMETLISDDRVKFEQPVKYLKLQEMMGRVDVNIAPLLINDFTNCKSELKFFEAAVVETVTIASPTYTFEKAISNGQNGFLAQPGEWYEKLEYIYAHPEESRKIAQAARKYALENYYGGKFLREVEEVYEYFTK